MSEQSDVVVRIAASDLDPDEVIESVARLRGELLDLDIDGLDEVSGAVPSSAKGPGTAVTLGVRLGAAALKAVVAKIRDWVSRNDRSVELTLRNDTIKIVNATPEQQEQLINAWLARHA